MQSKQIHEALEPGKMRVAALVGPTGVGKTTTVAKLAAYAGPAGTITRATVEALVPTAAEATVFALSDAIAQRRLGVALPLLHTLLDGGAAPE